MRRPAGNDPRFCAPTLLNKNNPHWGLLPVVDAAIWRQSAERLQILDWVRYGRAPSGTNLIGGDLTHLLYFSNHSSLVNTAGNH